MFQRSESEGVYQILLSKASDGSGGAQKMEHKMKSDATELMEGDERVTWCGSKKKGCVERKAMSQGLGSKRFWKQMSVG